MTAKKWYACIVGDDMDPLQGTFKQVMKFAQHYVNRPWVIEDPDGRIVARYDPLGMPDPYKKRLDPLTMR